MVIKDSLETETINITSNNPKVWGGAEALLSGKKEKKMEDILYRTQPEVTRFLSGLMCQNVYIDDESGIFKINWLSSGLNQSGKKAVVVLMISEESQRSSSCLNPSFCHCLPSFCLSRSCRSQPADILFEGKGAGAVGTHPGPFIHDLHTAAGDIQPDSQFVFPLSSCCHLTALEG